MPTHLHTQIHGETQQDKNGMGCTVHYTLGAVIYACMHVDKGSSIRYHLKLGVCVSTHSNREEEKRKSFQQLYDCIFWQVREEKHAAMSGWTGGVSISQGGVGDPESWPVCWGGGGGKDEGMLQLKEVMEIWGGWIRSNNWPSSQARGRSTCCCGKRDPLRTSSPGCPPPPPRPSERNMKETAV